MQNKYRSFVFFPFLVLSLIFLSGFSSEYTRKVEPLPNMPEGNPDPSLGIVIHSNSSGIDVLGDSSQNIRFSVSKNFDDTHIEVLRSSSMVDRTPKRFKFIDEKHGFSSDDIYEFSVMFDNKDHEWKSIKFMPFASVIHWVTAEEMKAYLKKWDKTFENAGWQHVECIQYDKSKRGHLFKLESPGENLLNVYCSWENEKYKVEMDARLRDPSGYIYYVPKKQRKSIKETPDGYTAFIKIYKKSKYRH